MSDRGKIARTPGLSSKARHSEGSPKSSTQPSRSDDGRRRVTFSEDTEENGDALSLTNIHPAGLMLWLFIAGVVDAVSVPKTFKFFMRSRTIRKRSLQCLLLNGIIFLGTLFLLQMLIIPFIHWFQSYNSFSQPLQKAATLYDVFIQTLYHILWVYPVYSISFILNTIWYQDIADHSYRVHFGRAPRESTDYDAWVKMMVDEIYRILLVGSFLVQILLCIFVPYVGTFAMFLLFCWQYSFYSFDYKWVLKGWSIEKRLLYVETHWAYFAGFGAPCTLATFFSTQFVSAGIWALIFPLFVMLATVAKPVRPPALPNKSKIPLRLPIFRIPRAINYALLKNLNV